MQATAAIEALLSRLAACVDDVVERARSGAELREGEAEGMCAALEELLAHRFKRRQFLLFSVHPWSLAEHAEALSSAAAVRIGVARQTGSTDSARLRAWLYLLLNRRELAAEVDALLTPELCSLMYTRGAALLGSAERDRLVRTLKPLAALRFRLGASAGLCLPEQPSGSLEARANTTATTTHRPTTHPPTTHHHPPPHAVCCHPNPPACRQDARLSAAACAADVPTADTALAAAAAAAVARAEAAAHADNLGDSAVARAALLSYETRGQT